MNEAEFQRLLETNWQRPLDPTEEARLEAWLAGHPGARTIWEEESGLNHLLGQLPDAPVSTHFTSGVLQALEREEAPPRWAAWAGFFRPAWAGRWMPHMAGAIVILTLCLAGVYLHQKHQLKKWQPSLRLVESLAALPHPELLQEFDLIQQLSNAPPTIRADLELLAALE